MRNTSQVPFDERHLGAIHRDIGARSHRDAHIGLSQGRCIVDPIARHGDNASFVLQFGNQGQFISRLYFRMKFLDLKICGDGAGCR